MSTKLQLPFSRVTLTHEEKRIVSHESRKRPQQKPRTHAALQLSCKSPPKLLARERAAKLGLRLTSFSDSGQSLEGDCATGSMRDDGRKMADGKFFRVRKRQTESGSGHGRWQTVYMTYANLVEAVHVMTRPGISRREYCTAVQNVQNNYKSGLQCF